MPLPSFPFLPTVEWFMGSSRVPSTSLQPCEGTLPALLPAGRGRPSAARWAFGTRARSQGATHDPWEMWDGGRRGREREEKGVPPRPPGPLSVRQIPAGWAHARVLSPG